LAQQKITPRYIDSQIKKIETLGREGKSDQYIKGNTLLLKHSKLIKYSRGIALGYLNLSYSLFFAGNYKKSMEYLKLARKEEFAQNDFTSQLRIKRLFSYNYISVGLYQQAISELREIALLSDDAPIDSVRLQAKTSSYIDIGLIHQEKKQFDSATIYIKKGINALQNCRKLTPRLKVILAWGKLTLIELKIDEKKIDSAKIYLKQLENCAEKLPGNYNFKLFLAKGKVCEETGNYQQAVRNYAKSVKLVQETKNIVALRDLYQSLSIAYSKNGNPDSATIYLKKFDAITDTLTSLSPPAIESTVQELVTQKENEINSKTRYFMYFLYATAVIVIMFFLVLFGKIRRERKIVMEKEFETMILSQKVNAAFNEVVQLAKKNDPEFLTRFQEVYPNIFPRLLEIEPLLLASELKFCALLFLNFSSKDIAEYTFVKPESVQTRKNRLRKKLNISSDEDLYIWMKNINNSRIHSLS
jgi:tetratricopeptide (TPR) repeat protein